MTVDRHSAFVTASRLCPLTTLTLLCSVLALAATPLRSLPPISGMKVALDRSGAQPGGVCVYRGCIPSKALLHVAKLLTEAKHASAWGLHFGEPDRDRQAARLEGPGRREAHRRHWASSQVAEGALHPGHARRSATRRSFEVETARRHASTSTFEHAILATGSRPATVPGARDRQPARDGFDRRARACRTCRRRCSSSAAGTSDSSSGRVYAALGIESDRRRDAAWVAAGRRSRSRQRAGEARRAMCEARAARARR